MKKRTDEEWRKLHENAICAILSGRHANDYFSNMSIENLVNEAIKGADYLLNELKKREDKEATAEL